ncbi:DUF6879 family protein [Streptomyces sp. NBC_00444]|uniref:DUF6879 family protein n=1 Tax=Streptomyces sp. NBC_00444 TaxID=2975744 RepID=UPI002E225A6E|nr:DUF6879 family protein [Streptomyces sp. NBC_00444]
MDLISPAQHDELFNSFERDAFHLELRDNYGSPVETPPTRGGRGVNRTTTPGSTLR